MPIRPELEEVVNIQRKNADLRLEIAQIEMRVKENNQRMIREFFPYLLSIYAGWRPRIGETAVVINLEHGHCFEVFIRGVNGYSVRTQADNKPIFVSFDLNPSLDEYEVAEFIVPQQNFMDDVKQYFGLQVRE